MSKIKILYLTGSFGTGGKERQLAELIKGLDETKFELYLMIKSEGAHYLDEVREKVSGLYNLNRGHFGWLAIFEIRNIIKEVNPDIIHSWASITSLYIVTLKILLKKTIIVIDGSIRQANPPSAQSYKEKLIRGFINRFSNYIISNSEAGHKAYRTPVNKASVIYNGFNFNRLEELQPKSEITQKYKAENAFIIGMVARFDPEKDWNAFLKIALSITRQHKDMVFICVGDGPLLQMNKDKIPTEAQDNIVFTGRSTVVESLVNVFDIAVLLSNNQIHGEGISNSVLEYMSLSKAVIVNDNGGNAELINSDDVGFLIKSDDLNLFINKILELKNNPGLRNFIGQNAKRRVQESFSFNKMIESYTQFYNNILVP